MFPAGPHTSAYLRVALFQTLTNAVWAVLRSKSQAADPNGILILSYQALSFLSPYLACGLLGAAEPAFVDICTQFKVRRGPSLSHA